MLFNSHIFLLAFLPITLAGFALLRRMTPTGPARLWLLVASLVFYGWWSLAYLGLLMVSLLTNYTVGQAIGHARIVAPKRARALLAFGITANLMLLGWHKYASFAAANLAALTGLDLAVSLVVLPLAISFYTFLQIAYLVDMRKGLGAEYSFIDYALFVTFFPHLVAGPIVHHHELIPQFHERGKFRIRADDMAAGLAFLSMGLVKKLVVADPVGALATPIFAGGASPGFIEAWTGAIAFAVGLYYDFSAYSDMAIGLARMFGIRFPYNFNSPYQATSIIDFWRRWHMTLSRFLRDYLYIPLGGSRQGPGRRNLNLMATMLLGGLWHGAGWNFIIWGGLHGIYLLVNHAWSEATIRARENGRHLSLGAFPSRAATLLAVLLAWVFFASPTPGIALDVLSGMVGSNGFLRTDNALLLAAFLQDGPSGVVARTGGTVLLTTTVALVLLAAALLMIFAAPNSQRIIDGEHAELNGAQRWHPLQFHPRIASAAITAAAFLLALALMADVKEFVYFQF
ncbi:MBOAT family O-acyltransferase [Muricoccus pecuniae]|uniref:Probable alginate O-acetylase AlgI n=1 Tax=Muricoccus pecuniae TaxID=693023 RepID=A0A840YJ56_9PROT|nr:MBOAT family O-acyltransferase [Roseomonas pecuniae]MBB5694702.1 D-alanyl-lipoteichoic acid acyltransferase DltB (MBOAT superfamily) [Roseomonas pecuniae]